MNDLSHGYFGEDKMLAYVKNIQREEIRGGVSAVKHQHEVGSNLGDDFKEMTGGDRALKAGGAHNTMNQFESADIRNPAALCLSTSKSLPVTPTRNAWSNSLESVRRGILFYRGEDNTPKIVDPFKYNFYVTVYQKDGMVTEIIIDPLDLSGTGD